MKYYEIKYWLHNQSTLFSYPQAVIAKSKKEADRIVNKIEECGYVLEQVRAFDPVPVEERFYA